MSTINYNIKNNAQLRLGKISNKNSDFTYNEFVPIINAVEIDWNGAEVETNKVINTTSDLLNWIKERTSSSTTLNEEQEQTINECKSLIKLLKEFFKNNSIEPINPEPINPDPNKLYWYIGVENPENMSDISNIQTDNTVPGWHEIGLSLSGFVLDTDANPIHLSNTRVIYYVIIPNGLNIYDALGNNGEYIFTTVETNISGYKAFRYVPSDDFPAGTKYARGITLKQ